MRALRRVALAGLVVLTAGTVWHAATGPEVGEARTVPRLRPSPVVPAVRAVEKAWAGKGPTSADHSCTPGPWTTGYPAADRAEVDLECSGPVAVSGGHESVDLVWRVELRWRSGRWEVTGVGP